jgi:hypothetical protein
LSRSYWLPLNDSHEAGQLPLSRSRLLIVAAMVADDIRLLSAKARCEVGCGSTTATSRRCLRQLRSAHVPKPTALRHRSPFASSAASTGRPYSVSAWRVAARSRSISPRTIMCCAVACVMLAACQSVSLSSSVTVSSRPRVQSSRRSDSVKQPDADQVANDCGKVQRHDGG